MKLDNNLLRQMVAESLNEIDKSGGLASLHATKDAPGEKKDPSRKSGSAGRVNVSGGQEFDLEPEDDQEDLQLQEQGTESDLQSSINFLNISLQHVKELIGKALDIQDAAKKQAFLSALQEKAADMLDMLDTIKNTVEKSNNLKEEVVSPDDIKKAEQATKVARTNLTKQELDLAKLKATDAKEALEESFQLTKGRLRQIISEELISAKKQGIL